MIRTARLDDLVVLQDIEVAAGEVFRGLGMHEIADDAPPTVEELRVFQADGRAWVATDSADTPIAYLLVVPVDSAAHIEQVSVHPKYSRRGLGRALIDVAAAWAHDHSLTALTLSTFAHVPWNAPYYQRLGFQIVSPDRLTAGLRRIREHETVLGLDRWPRVIMQRDLVD